MANFETETKFTEQMRKLETTDPAHADLFNSIIGALLNNDTFLRSVTNQLLLQLQQHISDSQAALDAYYQQSSGYTDTKIADLIGGAPTTLDTLGEIAQAMKENESVVAALDAAVGKKANAAEFDSHVKDKANPHAVTKAQVGLENVDNTADANKYVKFSAEAGNANTANYASSAGNANTVDDYHAYQLQNCTTAGVPEATYIKSTYNYGTFLLKAYNSSGNAVCGVEVEKAAKAGSADSVAYSNVAGRPNMYWEGDVFHIDF